MNEQSSGHLKAVIDSIPDPVMVIGADYVVNFMNAAARSSARASSPAADGRLRCYQVNHRADSPCASTGEPCPYCEVFRTGKPVTVYHRHVDAAGGEDVVEVSASPVVDERGDVVEVVEVHRRMNDNDIARRLVASELRQQASRDALAREHEELQRLFTLVKVAKQEWEEAMDCVEDMVVLTDKDGAVMRCNKAFKDFTGKKYDELLGMDCIGLLVEHGIEIDTLHSGELEVFHRPGKLWYRVSTSLVMGEDADQVAGSVVTLHDSTDIRLMTQKLEQTNRETEENRLELQKALDELSLLIQRVGREQTFGIRYQNPNLVQCWEVKNCSKTHCPCHGKEPARCWQIAGTFCGNEAQGAFTQKYANCIECDVFRTATPNPIFQIGEHFNNMMHILETKNRELENAYSELKLTQSKILQQEKMASIGQLAAGVAHEINNPMGFIASNLGTLNRYLERIYEYVGILAEIAGSVQAPGITNMLADARKRLKMDFVADDARKLIAESLDGADRVKTIVRNLKSFSRVDQAEAKLSDVNDCIETTLNIVWNELKYKATVKKEYGKLPLTMCYPQQLNQVFMNLLVNAAQAIEGQGEITIRTGHRDGSIFASVTDTGAGISGKHLSQIFEPFFTTKEVGKGTGLGLSITYDIVKKHHGDITVDSEPGKGSTFTVRIPVVEKI